MRGHPSQLLFFAAVLSLLFAPLSGTIYAAGDVTFKKVRIMQNVGKKFKEKKADLTFREKFLVISVKKGVDVEMAYDDIVSAEYSYSKNPRWKTGLGLGAASVVFPPLLLIAIPLGFTKHRRHWLTIRTNDKFAVLKLSKDNRKLVLPTLETRSGVTVTAVGEDK
ncbi:MAG: hypothetical protein HKN33_04820 [Pyrinomonadaceae bacterium]|nr:hypothetical protein [Pyrinomonadaceae bacterium]